MKKIVVFLSGRGSNSRCLPRSPVDEWIAFLKDPPAKAVWLVEPAGPRNLVQQRKYESALKAAGFSRVRGIPGEFDGYPTTKLALWKKRWGGGS